MTYAHRTDPFVNQACAELAFARAMGWDDWHWEEETEEGMVRGYRVQWTPDSDACLVVYDEGDDDARWVLVTGFIPTHTVHGWITVGAAKRKGRRVGEG